MSRETGRALFDRLVGLTTEARNPRTSDLDRLDSQQLVRRLNAEDRLVAEAVGEVLDDVARAVDLAVSCFERGGRLFYVGAGTSGRLGVLDAAECPPTFGTDPTQVQGIIAGGADALVGPIEGAEDVAEDGRAAIDERDVGGSDLVLGIAASWRTPYTVAAVTRAKERGAATAYLTTNPPERVEIEVDVLIAPQVGPEALMGSTRMKSGTAQKLVLNLLTTASMVRMGKVYENMMVDLMATSEKLKERSKRVVMVATGADYETADAALVSAGGSVKRAIVMIESGASADRADQALTDAGGFVWRALERLGGSRA